MKPFKYFCDEPDLKEVVDTAKNYKLCGNNFLLYLDDMAGTRKVDPAKIKKIVTALESSARIYNTQDRATVKNISTFIASTNLPIRMIIEDTSGNRRFVELPMCKMQRQHFTMLKGIDIEALIQSVQFEYDTEEAELNILDSLKRSIAPSQEENRYIDDLEDFKIQADIKSGEDLVRIVDLLESYTNYLKNLNKKHDLNTENFGKEMTRRFKLEKIRGNKGQCLKIDRVAFRNANQSLVLSPSPYHA